MIPRHPGIAFALVAIVLLVIVVLLVTGGGEDSPNRSTTPATM